MTATTTAGSAPVQVRPGATDPARVATAFMIISMGVMVLTIVFALVLQHPAGYLLCAAMYVVKVYAERHHGITSPLSMALLACYAALFGLSLTRVDFVGYAGVIVFSVLGLVVGGLLAMGKPFTTFYSHGRGDRAVHNAASVIWLITYAAAIGATLYLIPSMAFLYVPVIICLVGASATMFVNFVWCGPSSTRQHSFKVDDLEFVEIAHDGLLFEGFCHFYARCIAEDPRQGAGEKTVAEIADTVRSSELALGSDSFIFVCLLHGEIVGSIRCILDRPGRPFPTEADGGFSLDALRQHGRVMAVGRLAIAEDLRARPDVLSHLFACFVNLALERDIAFVLSAGFRHVVPTYLKLGFDLLFHRSDPRHGVRMSHGFVSHPVLLDFTRLIFDRVRNNGAKLDFYGVTHKYLAERWFKRALVREWMRLALGRSWPNGIDAVRYVLATGGAQPVNDSASDTARAAS